MQANYVRGVAISVLFFSVLGQPIGLKSFEPVRVAVKSDGSIEVQQADVPSRKYAAKHLQASIVMPHKIPQRPDVTHSSVPPITLPASLVRQNPAPSEVMPAQQPTSLSSSPQPVTHWKFEFQMPAARTIICSIALVLSSILCACGGAKTSGVVIAVLVGLGQFSPHDAVPLSNAINLFGLMPVLPWAMLRPKIMFGRATGSETENMPFDYSICRVALPAVFAGSLLGTFANSCAPDWVILLCIGGTLALAASALASMSYKNWWTTAQQENTAVEEKASVTTTYLRRKPQEADVADADASTEADASSNANDASTEASAADGTTEAHASSNANDATSLAAENPAMDPSKAEADDCHRSRTASSWDIFICLALLKAVVAAGVLVYYVNTCARFIQEKPSLVPSMHESSCRLPIAEGIFPGQLEAIVRHIGGVFLCAVLVLIPLAACLAISSFHWNIKDAAALKDDAALFGAGVVAGFLPGFMGLGGGMVLTACISPVEPAIAAGTTVLCLLAGLVSTTLQCFPTGRLLIVHAIGFGCLHMLAQHWGSHAGPSRPSELLGSVLKGCFSVLCGDRK